MATLKCWLAVGGLALFLGGSCAQDSTGVASTPVAASPSEGSFAASPSEEPAATSTPPGGPPGVARILCQDIGPGILETPSVRAHRVGVRIVAVNPTDATVGFWGGSVTAHMNPGQTRHLTIDAAPGHARVRCGGGPNAEGSDDSPVLHVQDPNGFYRSGRLECGEFRHTVWLGGPHPRALRVHPMQQAREQILGRLPGDALDVVRYPSGPIRIVRLVREDRGVMLIEYDRSKGRRWTAAFGAWCSWVQLGVSTSQSR